MIAPAILTRWRGLLDPDGNEWQPGSWEEFFQLMTKRRVFAGKNEHPGWSPARFEPCKRAVENVQQVFALSLDFDHGETIEGVMGRLSGFFGFLHTSRSHTPESHRFRVVLPLSRPVSRFEFGALWVRFVDLAGNADEAAKDASRFWFLPGCDDGAEYRTERLSGAAIDVDEWLSKPDPRAVQPRPTPRLSGDQRAVEERAAKYIAKMPEAIAGSGGHQATWAVAVVLARGFGLSEDATFRLLWNDYNPRCSPPWNERALRHKAKQATNAGRVPLGYLLNDNEPEWTPRAKSPEASEMPDPDFWDDGCDEERDESPPESDPREISKPHQETAAERWGVVTMKAMLIEVFVDATAAKKARGCATGVKEIDTQIGGYRAGNVTILGAQSSWGKSSWGVMALDVNHAAKRRVLVISVEDKRLLYGRRIACRMGGIDAYRMRDSELLPGELSTLAGLADSSDDEYVFLDAIGKPIEDVARAVRELCKELKFELVIADYIQRFRSKRSLTRRDEVTLVAALLSDEIKRANAAGLLLSQLKRTQGQAPTMEDMKESGDIEIMAEHVLLGWRKYEDKKYSRLICVPKNKDGEASNDWKRLHFDDKTASFTGKLLSEHGGDEPVWDDYNDEQDGFGDARYP